MPNPRPLALALGLALATTLLAMPAASIESIIVDHTSDSLVANTRPR